MSGIRAMIRTRTRAGRAIKYLVTAALVTSTLLVLVPWVFAQSGGPYDLTWSTVDGGGWTFSMGGDYTLGGTIGQPDPGLHFGGSYTLVGGFWDGSAVVYRLHLPLILRDAP